MALPGRGLTNAQREAYRRKLDEREVVGCELVVARYHTPTLLDLVESRHGGQLSAARAPIGMSASGQSGKRVLNQSITGFDPKPTQANVGRNKAISPYGPYFLGVACSY